MKKLICLKDIQELVKQGQKSICVSKGTILTPSAKDLCASENIEIVDGCTNGENSSEESGLDLSKISSDDIYKILKLILENASLANLSNKPYNAETHSNGLKVVRGNSVKMDVFDTGTPGTNVHFQELISKDESKMSSGFLEIDNSHFEWELTYEEIDYVIDGTLTVTIDGKTYTANKGDVLFVPKDTKVIWGSPNKAKVFYVTYPANWADLL